MSTSISELPTPSNTQQPPPFIQTPQPQQQSQHSIKPNEMKEIISSLEQSDTHLQNRDIPIQQRQYQDTQSTPNYIPESHGKYKLRDIEQNDNMYVSRIKEFQIPIIIGLLYFIFQLPIINNILLKYIPTLFMLDGNLSLAGQSTKAILFSCLYVVLLNKDTF